MQWASASSRPSRCCGSQSGRIVAPLVLQQTGEVDGVRLGRAYLSAIALGFTNPLTVILFLAALHAFSTQSAAMLLVAGVFVGSAIWWTVLSTLVATARSRL